SSPQICTSEVPVMCSWERSTSCACAEAVTPSGASSAPATATATATRLNLFISCSPLRGAHRGRAHRVGRSATPGLVGGGTGILTVRPHKKLTLLSRAASVGPRTHLAPYLRTRQE